MIDEQAAKVHRPATFCLTLDSVQQLVDEEAMIAKLMPLLKRERDDVLHMLYTRKAVIRRRLDHVSAQRLAKTLDLIGCNVTVEKDVRWVDQGHIITSAGISAGIDMALHLVSRLDSESLVLATAKQMDYRWLRNNATTPNHNP